ncbi:MAG: ComEA family DNA-binding protein [FCB group bacterium]|nr:ComEA family DNA-binding protein [FCB group bacterium]
MLSKLLTRREQLVLLALAGGLLVGSVTLYAFRNKAEPELAEALTFAPSPSHSVETPPVRPPEAVAEPEAPLAATVPPVAEPVVAVSVRGAVTQPGVYEFSPGARVQEAVDRAGGTLDTADLSDLNLAARLLDGTTLTVPEAPEANGRIAARSCNVWPDNPPEYTISGWRNSPAASSPAAAPGAAPAERAATGLMDLNTASETELQSLPGIGPKLASQIVQYRAETRFARVEDLEQVSGIGPKKLESIRPFVTVR